MLTLFILSLSVIIGSFLCSLSEAAILSLPLIRARVLYEENRKNAKDLLYIKENVNLTVASIVIVNNAINICGSVFIGQKVAELFGNQWLGFASGIITFILIVVSEVIPKTIGERFKIPVSLFFAKPLKFLLFVLRPIVELILKMAGMFAVHHKMSTVTEDEIKMMLKLGRDAGTVEMDEEVLCGRVFRLNDLRTNQMMRPMDRVFALPADKTLDEIREEIIDSKFSRIAVYGKNPLDIIGVVEHRLLLRHIARNNGSAFVKEFMSKPIFINHLVKADALLEKFQAFNQHLFIVQNDRNENIGIITMEDVLEELFGEILDEKDIRTKGRHEIKAAPSKPVQNKP